MVKINIAELLEENKRSKYWLCQKMNITLRNLNRVIYGETKSISFRYIEELCTLLNCEPGDLITITAPYLIDNEEENSEFIFM